MASIQVNYIKELKTLKLKNPTIIVGFPGAGLVGSIAANYLSTNPEFYMIGAIDSDKLAPVAAIHNYRPLPPIRIMASEEKNMIVILSEASIPLSLSMKITDFIFKLSNDLKSSMIISLGGMANPKTSEKRKAYIITSSQKAEDLARRSRIGEPIKEGATTGITAQLITKSYFAKKDMIALLIECTTHNGDPVASSVALKLLSKLLNTNIDTSKLDKEAKEYEKSTEETAIKSLSSVSNSSMYG